MPQQQLQRSRKNRVLFGVCGGLGDYTNVDPVIYRILFVLLALANGLGLLLYLILTVVIPE
ncbi:MAG: PspC domain-containing protein, partial [Candidatus Kerfeldbacteria bacterium]